MSRPDKPSGCSKMLRRTFLFLIGLAIARQLTIFFSIAENRSNFISILIQLTQKLTAWLSSLQTNQAPQSLPTAPIPKPSENLVQVPKAPTPKLSPASPKQSRSIEVIRKIVTGVPLYQTTIDLTDPKILMEIGLANNAKLANSPLGTTGDEPFEKMVDRYQAAVVVNGTFFGKDTKKWVLGNMVTSGKFVKYSRWENYGTTLGLRAGNQPEMITARVEGRPEWNQHWFSITCGPRLLKQGKIWLAPKLEGFSDPHVLNVGWRSAIGFSANGKELYLVTFLKALSLAQEAQVMKAIGCYEAMNLDGGASVGLAHKGQILLPPGRNLTNAIVVYDKDRPAPQEMQAAWQAFQKGDRPSYPVDEAGK